jgi:hypothetical protein
MNIFTSSPVGAEPGWEWQTVNPRVRYRGRERALRNQLESQRCKYTLPLHKRFIDLRESRLGQQLKQERYNNRMRILM